ncbi:hypothetical protein [uncultured Apibacter sp.]|uniref:hypothetical protein n=1 Tax=uncultured Apibacter sp. TaxID=1778616 RepID=UPI0025D0CD0F|nr:hypothetical protein [uncultured Apibacter sp.]
MLNLNFVTPREGEGTAKLTVHKSGRLGFSKSAIELLNVENYRYCKFAFNKEDETDENIYMVLNKESDEFSFNISKAGEYYYIKAKNFLSDLKIDYTDDAKTYIFDIYKMDNEDLIVYKLKKRIIKKQK